MSHRNCAAGNTITISKDTSVLRNKVCNCCCKKNLRQAEVILNLISNHFLSIIYNYM